MLCAQTRRGQTCLRGTNDQRSGRGHGHLTPTRVHGPVEWLVSVRHPGAVRHAGPPVLSVHGLRSPSSNHRFESSISSPDLPGVTDRNGRVLRRMPGAGGPDNKFCLVSKQAREGSPCPLRWPRSTPGATEAPSCDSGQPAARRALSPCKPGVRASELRVDQAPTKAVPAP